MLEITPAALEPSATTSQAIKRALEILDQNGVVGIPTETVYGLAARLDRPQGLEKIFSVKQRPFFDPLIVHVESVEMAQRYVKEWNEICSALAVEFWPGPLSLVLEKSNSTPDIVTSGLATVAVRMPRNPSTLELIRRAGVGLAAPSANRFGKSSPTSREHVLREFEGSVFVVDGDASDVGIESTVLRVRGRVLSILRPGIITRTQIDHVLHKYKLSAAWDDTTCQSSTEAPGQLKHHYMPDVPLVLTGENNSTSEVTDFINAHIADMPNEIYGQPVIKPTEFRVGQELQLSADPLLAARELYGSLRTSAQSRADFIFFRVRREMTGEIWSAIFDRLSKAASLTMDSLRQ